MKKRLLIIACGILFLSLTVGGLFLARHKRLWGDETHSLVSSVEKLSYSEILTGKIREGNKSPLFYVLQKVTLQAVGYRAPQEWHLDSKYWDDNGPRDRILVRIAPVVCMALAIVLIFYFFSNYYSLPAGVFSLFLCLSTNMLWRYIAEARPYALWVFLTTCQVLLLVHMIRTKNAKGCVWTWFAMVHILLSLTVVFSLAQIVVAGVVAFLFVERRFNKYLVSVALPAVICLFFYFTSLKLKFWLEFSLEQYIRAGFSRDRLYLLGIYVIYLLFYFLQTKKLFFRLYRDDTIKQGLPVLMITSGFIATVAAVYVVFRFKECPRDVGFPVTDRYFIHLAPVGIISASCLADILMKAFRDKLWMRVILAAGIAALVLTQANKVVPQVKGHYPELFSSEVKA